jgi:hypothetical protein
MLPEKISRAIDVEERGRVIVRRIVARSRINHDRGTTDPRCRAPIGEKRVQGATGPTPRNRCANSGRRRMRPSRDGSTLTARVKKSQPATPSATGADR